jgi:hypothetical protein
MYSKPQFLHAQTYLNEKIVMLILYAYSMGKPIEKTIIPFFLRIHKKQYTHTTLV